MQIWTTTVADEGMRELAYNADRLEAAEALVASAARAGTALVVLPAGFLRARTGTDAAAVAARLTRCARRQGVALVVGVIAAGASGRVRTWRQRSTSGANGARLDDIARRTIQVGDREVDVVACGEVWSPRLRAALAGAGRVVAAPSRAAAGARFWAARRWADGAGAHLVRAVHASDPAAVVEGAPVWDDGPPWLRAWSVEV